MPELFEQMIERLRTVWVAMTLNQKVITGSGLAALLVAALYISTLSDRLADYTVLFGNLDAKSANETITLLEQQKIPYKITQNGTAIEVPVEHADRLKIELTAEGLPKFGVVGYEILETTNFGMSDFLEKKRYRQALEGELSRTLMYFDDVEFARVHLVIPEKTLFKKTEQRPTAGVVIKLKRSGRLPPAKVEVIADLIASAAVEGLDPGDVTISDTRGNRLSKQKMDPLTKISSTVLDLRESYEIRQEERIRSHLERAVGPGKVDVVVKADLDFDRLERMTTTYDQEKSAPASSETIEVTNPNEEGGGEETSITNWDNAVIVENLVKSPGSTLNRLTVSVMIDHRDSTWVDENNLAHVEKLPRSPEELAAIRSVCEGAIGYDVDRGDMLVVENVLFEPESPEIGEVGGGLPFKASISEIVKAITMGFAILAALGIFFVVVRLITRTLDPSRITISAEKEFEKHREELKEEKIPESERAILVKKIISKAAIDPEITQKALKTIYREE